MPGYVIHLAIGKRYIDQHQIKDKKEFLAGIISPDLLDKKISHYGNSSNPNFQKFIENNPLNTDYNQGYFLHLVTDYLFYNKYLTNFSEEIYHDYNKLNEFFIQKYNIIIPPEVKNVVKKEEGEPRILKKDTLCHFIESVARIDLEKCKENEKYISEYPIERNRKIESEAER